MHCSKTSLDQFSPKSICLEEEAKHSNPSEKILQIYGIMSHDCSVIFLENAAVT